MRDVVLYGSTAPTCITCHRVHVSATARHERLPQAPICLDCHEPKDGKLVLKLYTVESALCEYEGLKAGR